MASISIGLPQGIDQAHIADVVVGTASPSASTDVEIRFNSTANLSGNTLTRKDVILGVRALLTALESGHLLTPVTVNGTSPWLGTPIL